MSGMILCRTKTAVNPYRIDDMGVRIYSLEELCYYIYNNIYLIGSDFIDDRLIDFIENETGEQALANRLKELLAQRAGIAEMLVIILKYVDYYSIEEIESIKGVLDTLSTKNVLERMKARGDSFLENNCYHSAINNYCKILESPYDNTLSAMFYAKVYHNIGVAYTQLFLYEQAAPYFDEAYRIGQHEKSKRCSMAAARLALGDNIIERDDATEDEYVVKREIETIMDNAGYSDDYRKLQEIDQKKADGQVAEYYQQISDMMENWKRQYLNYIK